MYRVNCYADHSEKKVVINLISLTEAYEQDEPAVVEDLFRHDLAYYYTNQASIPAIRDEIEECLENNDFVEFEGDPYERVDKVNQYSILYYEDCPGEHIAVNSALCTPIGDYTVIAERDARIPGPAGKTYSLHGTKEQILQQLDEVD